MKYCEYCGIEVAEIAKFCNKCGKEVINIKTTSIKNFGRESEKIFERGMNFLFKEDFYGAIKQFQLFINSHVDYTPAWNYLSFALNY